MLEESKKEIARSVALPSLSSREAHSVKAFGAYMSQHKSQEAKHGNKVRRGKEEGEKEAPYARQTCLISFILC